MSRLRLLALVLLFPVVMGTSGLLLADERQGGETMAEPTIIWSLPYFGEGTTDLYHDDYDEPCPDPSDSPDVVYVYRSGAYPDSVTIDLCAADYDTKVYVYEVTFNPPDTVLIACNDDYDCPRSGDSRAVQSRLDHIYPQANGLIYIIVDGSNGESGGYGIYMGNEGACCLPSGECLLTAEETCAGEGGTFQGELISCDPNPCSPTPAAEETWGRLKGRFLGQP